MDCEKFESLIIDELYGELDELTSAASKRHLAGCVRCSSLIGGLKATRRLAVLPTIEPPADLESKIMAAALEAQKVVPFRTRLSRAVSRAGSWAMRPQTTMAATFLLMIGASLVLLRSRSMSAPTASQVSITENGAPAAASAAPTSAPAEAMDMQAAANAHGMLESERKAAMPQTTQPITADKAASGETVARAEGADGLLKGAGDPYASNADQGNAYGGMPGSGGGASLGAASSAMPMAVATATAAPPAAAKDSSSGAFADAMTAYRAKNYDEATRDFDALAGAGDNNAALWAARSVREQSGCVAAVNRFDQLSGRAFGTTPGYDATYESGECYKSMGAFDAARQRFSRLLTVPAYATRAQNELAKMANPPNVVKPSRAVAPAPAQQMNNSAY